MLKDINRAGDRRFANWFWPLLKKINYNVANQFLARGKGGATNSQNKETCCLLHTNPGYFHLISTRHQTLSGCCCLPCFLITNTHGYDSLIISNQYHLL